MNTEEVLKNPCPTCGGIKEIKILTPDIPDYEWMAIMRKFISDLQEENVRLQQIIYRMRNPEREDVHDSRVRW